MEAVVRRRKRVPEPRSLRPRHRSPQRPLGLRRRRVRDHLRRVGWPDGCGSRTVLLYVNYVHSEDHPA